MRLFSRKRDDNSLGSKLEQKLASNKPADIAEVEAAVREMGPEAVDRLMETLRKQARQRRYFRRVPFILLGIYAALFLTMMLAGVPASSLGGMFGGMGGVFAGYYTLRAAQKNTTRILAQFDDIRAVGPLSEALQWKDKDMGAVASEALIRLLPRLNASDAGLLNGEQRTALYSALAPRAAAGYPKLALAVLRALEQVGDEKAVPAVERLIADPHPSTAVREAAVEALPAIRQRAEMLRAASLLLRPSESPVDPGATLLRPASAGPASEESLLLRPASTEPAIGGSLPLRQADNRPA